MRQTAAVVNVLQQQNEMLSAQLEESHAQTETLAALLRSLDRPMALGIPSPGVPGTPVGRRGSTISERVFYYKGEKVSTGPGVVAVMLLQVINVVSDEYMAAAHPTMTTDNPLSFKELRSVVTAAVGL